MWNDGVGVPWRWWSGLASSKSRRLVATAERPTAPKQVVEIPYLPRPFQMEIHDTLHEVIHDVFARQDEIAQGPEILAALRRSLDVMFPERPLTPQEMVRLGEKQSKSIFLHHYMDRHDFDLERLRKCCHHYPQLDGRIMPACGFNMFHRGAAQGQNTPLPTWGKQPWNADPHGGTPYLLEKGEPPVQNSRTRLPIVG